MLYYLNQNFLPHTSENYDLLYHCTGCLACREFCAHQISVQDLLIKGRTQAYGNSRHNKRLDTGLKNIKRYGAIYSEALNDRLRSEFDSVYFSSSLKVKLFVGCVYTKKQIETVKKTIFILERLGIDYVGIYSEKEICCGYPLYASGFEQEFSNYISKVRHNLSGQKKIVVLCPACTYALKSLYQQYDNGIRAEILTFSEFILPYIRTASKNRKKITEHYSYHDPCFMSRYLNQTEEPREIITKTGAILSEFLWNKKNSICCGGGSMFPSTNRDISIEIAKRRIDEFSSTGAKAIVTSCPTCIDMFRKADANIEIKDLIDVIYDFLNN